MRKSILFGIGIVVGTLIVPGVSAAKDITQVFITNDANNPVPVAVQGTSQVAGTVNVGNTPTVNVGNTPTVNVGGEPTSREPYEKTIFFNQDANSCTQFVCAITFDPVPAGKRLVVTYASAQWALTSGGNFATAVVGVNGDGFNEPEVLLPPAVLAGFVNYVTAGPLTFYVEAGDKPSITVGGQFVLPSSNTSVVSIVGYYVDV